MHLQYYISPSTYFIVQGGFLNLHQEKALSKLILNSRQVSKFVSRLFLTQLKPEFKVLLADNIFLCEKKLVFDTVEETFGKNDLDNFIHGLITCLPFMLLDGPDTQMNIAAVTKFAIFVAEKKSFEEGEECWKQIKSGVHQDWLLEFCEKSNCDTSQLLNFIFFHCNLIKSIWLLRRLLLKKNPSPDKA